MDMCRAWNAMGQTLKLNTHSFTVTIFETNANKNHSFPYFLAKFKVCGGLGLNIGLNSRSFVHSIS